MSMNRVIKFRAWDGEKMIRRLHCVTFEGTVHEYERDSDKERSDLVLMQFTGLTDRSEKEIWEGDIVEWDGINYAVEYEQAGFWLAGYDNEYGWPDTGDCHVVGNLYENPEMLSQD